MARKPLTTSNTGRPAVRVNPRVHRRFLRPRGAGVGAGFGDQAVAVELTGLDPNTTYYYRVLAHNENGTTESSQSRRNVLHDASERQGVLADHRAWELVSPPEKHGAEVKPSAAKER